MFKKLLCSLIAIITFSSTAFAEITPIEIKTVELTAPTFMDGFIAEYSEADFEVPENTISLFSAKSMSAVDYIKEKLSQHVSEINVSSYNISSNELDKIYFETLFTNPMLPVAPRFNYQHIGNKVIAIKPEYVFSSRYADSQAYTRLDAFIRQIYSYANAGKTPLEKTLLAYQKIIYECDYDPNPTIDENGNKSYTIMSHTPYGFVENGYAVCQGYSLLMREVLSRLGIPSAVVTCQVGINHMWNYIQLDGKWYHADVTNGKMYYPDGSPARGYNNMDYFLRSDSIAYHGSKQNWNVYELDTLPDCNSHEYESGYMFNNNQSMIYKENDKLVFDFYVKINNKVIAIPFSSKKLKATAFFSDTKNNNGTYDRYMYSFESFPNAHWIYAKYNDIRFTDCITEQVDIQSDTLYLLQQNTAVPDSGKSNKFMLWDKNMITPLSECIEAK